ncbi:MAG: cupin domain-containing protein [Candidatus Binatia bacterium]
MTASGSMTMHRRAAELVRTLGLAPHPEGGFFREVFRSTERVQPLDSRASRSALTTIFFLLVEGQASRWHAVASDEVWHLYEGGPLELLVAPPDVTRIDRTLLGSIGSDALPMHTVPARCWQAARPLAAYALAGCSVGPGFEFEDFHLLADDPRAAAALRASAPELALLL